MHRWRDGRPSVVDARLVQAAGVALVSTGSTASKIAAAGVPVTKVEELTGFP
ncbi:hypothetical protein, partial [Streptomyces sp. NPDC089915]|uniref:hypothetical protein n=1 Tax=Streptomyces sp. NPDC089915 TaxID=3155186 RepID=UPI0034262A8E